MPGKPSGPARSDSESLEHQLRFLDAHPDHIPTLKGIASSLRSLGRNTEALKYLVKAVLLQPADADLLCELGDTWERTGYFKQAIAAYQKALELAPELSRAFYSLGCAQIEAGEYVPAIRSFESAIGNGCDSLEAHHNLARALYEMGDASGAFAQFQISASMPRPQSERSRAMSAVIVPGVPEADNRRILEVRRAWAERDLRTTASVGGRNLKSPRERVRLGYVSSFFHRDNWMKPVWALINQHDRKSFEINLFSDGPATSIQHGYRSHTEDRFFDTSGFSNDALAELIRHREIDILIDLNGYSNINRLPMFGLRPAPVIIAWFNMYATTGMQAFDYLVGDQHVVTAEEERFYSERILRVSGSYLTFEVAYPVPAIGAAPCNSNGTITFGSLASQYKITKEVMAVWSGILQGVPGSSLLLKNKHLRSKSAQTFVQRMFNEYEITSDRLFLEGPENHFDFLKAYDRIDLALDTFPYNGGTTTTEALWQGVPVLTFSGDRWASRTSASILRAAQLGEFVANDLDGFIALAIRLGTSTGIRQRLAEFRKNIRPNLLSAPICNTETFAREMEDLYRRTMNANKAADN